jgi:mannose-6-phosphate isomerase
MDATRPWRLEGVVRRYAWGSRTAIPELLGREPDGEPQAELWLGAHPSAPSRVVSAAGAESLDACIRRDPEAVLGASVRRRFGDELPFLFKVLAAAEPLSIQAHPDRDQARAGFARENAAGLAVDAPTRSYRDPHHKPELICALTPFRALNRFREPAAIADALAASDPAMARAAYDRAEAIVQRDVPLVPLTYGTGWALSTHGLLGAGQNGLGYIRMAGLAWAD